MGNRSFGGFVIALTLGAAALLSAVALPAASAAVPTGPRCDLAGRKYTESQYQLGFPQMDLSGLPWFAGTDCNLVKQADGTYIYVTASVG